MLYEAFGKLHAIFPEMQVTEKFRKREFVLEIEDGNYPQHVKFQFTQDKCSALNSFQQGEKVKLVFGLSGREATSKDGNLVYYTNLSAWKLERIDDGAGAGNPAQSRRVAAPAASAAASSDDDDIPF
jgi:single-strand DNA-binding protein